MIFFGTDHLGLKVKVEFWLGKQYNICAMGRKRDYNLDKLKGIIRKHKSKLENDFNIKKIGIFGSYVRGEQTKTSDLDVLVEFNGRVGFFKFLELEEYLENILGIKVDLVSRKALKPRIGTRILSEVLML